MSHSLLSRETLWRDFSETGKSYQPQVLHQESFYCYNDSWKVSFQSVDVNLDFWKTKKISTSFQVFWCFFLRFKLYILFWSKLRISTLKLIHVQNLSQIGQKIKDFDLKHGRDDIIKIFYVFERFCARVSSCQAWTSNKWETREGGFFIFCTIFYQNSPAWTRLRMVKSVINQEICSTVNLLIQQKFWGH